MPTNTKAIKARIASVKNTKKITKAMEMVAAAKMRRAVEAAMNTRTYAAFAWEILKKMSEIDEPNVPLLATRRTKRILLILVSSNRGLCGSFNSNLFKYADHALKEKQNIARHRKITGEEIDGEGSAEITVDVLGIGKKSASFARRQGLPLIAVYDSLPDRLSYEDILPIARQAMARFIDTSYDKVVIASTSFESTISQTPKLRQLLPLSHADIGKMLQGVRIDTSESPDDIGVQQYLFEPSQEDAIEHIMPRLVEAQLYQAVLESIASEHSARMVAMKNASDAASDMIEGLTLEFNKGRQAAITQEIAEIAGGAAALSHN